MDIEDKDCFEEELMESRNVSKSVSLIELEILVGLGGTLREL